MNRIQKLLIGIIVIVALIGTGLIIVTINTHSHPYNPEDNNTNLVQTDPLSENITVFIQKQLDQTPKKTTNRFAPTPFIFASNFYDEVQMNQLYDIVNPSQQTFRFSMQFSAEEYDQSFLIIDVYVQGKLSDSWIDNARILNIVVYENYVSNSSLLRFDGTIDPAIPNDSTITLEINGSLFEDGYQAIDDFDIDHDSMVSFRRKYSNKENLINDIHCNITLNKAEFENNTPVTIQLDI